jgi:hypothetical protein
MATSEHSLPWLHSLDHSVLAILRLEQNMVSRDHGITRFASDGADDSANGAFVAATCFHLPGIGLDNALSRSNRRQDASASTKRFVDVDDDVVAFEVRTDDGPFASLIAFA